MTAPDGELDLADKFGFDVEAEDIDAALDVSAEEARCIRLGHSLIPIALDGQLRSLCPYCGKVWGS